MRIPLLACLFGLFPAPLLAQGSFVNFETPHVTPLALASDGSRLYAVNTADDRLEVFDTSGAAPVYLASIPVGFDPVSVRLRSDDEAWVVNHVSDSVSIVDLAARNVVRTISTDDEPCDVVFAGAPERAFISCSQANTVLVFDPANLSATPVTLPIDGEDPRAMATSADGSEVYVLVFESGNGSTILGGGSTMGGAFPPNVVSHPSGPYGGQNPPPNDGAGFDPPLNGANPAAPAVGLIVKENAGSQWLDDNGGNWTSLVSGASAAASGRPVGWDLPDRDVAVIDAGTLSIDYASRVMNICMALAVHPTSGDLAVIGTDATNEVRFEPVLNGRFLRVNVGFVDPSGPATTSIVDLNAHLDYMTSSVPQATRDQSLGDPRGIVWNAAGSKAYVSGMGSNNLVVIDPSGARVGAASTIEVGEGPTGLAIDSAGGVLYVLNKFDGSISVVDLGTELETARVPYFDPSPGAIRVGRKHLYDTRKNSGLGHISCGSCHIDARMDQLAWDLGDPAGAMKSIAGQNLAANIPGLNAGFEDWHPMKGPMTTQTLQDIIGKEPFHWRGDKDGLEEFNGAFVGLQGDDTNLTPAEMQEYEDFLATLHFPPNPFRNLDNSLPTSLPLPGHFSTGRFGAAGLPLPNGNAVTGLLRYRTGGLDTVQCATCHTLPTGIGPDMELIGFTPTTIPPGPNGERHHALISLDGSTNVTMKTPQLRNMHEKVGFETSQTSNTSGFGFLHDGSVDSIARFVSEPVFSLTSDQDVADQVAFMLAFAGSDLPMGSTGNVLELPGPPGQDAHAAVGTQTTLRDSLAPDAGQALLIAALEAFAEADAIGLIVKGKVAGHARGYMYLSAGVYQSDRGAETHSAAALFALAEPGSELTWTAVPFGTETRAGVDRDLDGFFDRDEVERCSDPADALSIPQPIGLSYCAGDGTAGPCPCGNEGGPGEGCQNSSGAGATLCGSGSASVSADDLFLAMAPIPVNEFGLFFTGTGAIGPFPFGDGLRCVGGSVFRFPILNAGSAGTIGFGPVVGFSNSVFGPGGQISVGSTWNYQGWYRDPNGACSSSFNLTNGMAITYGP
jgi:YVTN family beta-propeller protein